MSGGSSTRLKRCGLRSARSRHGAAASASSGIRVAGDNTGMTIDEELSALMDQFFLAVSFGTGGTPAYERLHDLFTPAGRLINAIGDVPDDTTVAGFIGPRRALVDTGVLT